MKLKVKASKRIMQPCPQRGYVRCSFHRAGSICRAPTRHDPGGPMSSHMFWIGVLFALTFAFILPAWLTGLLFVVALFASDVLTSVTHAHSSAVPYLIIGLILFLAG